MSGRSGERRRQLGRPPKGKPVLRAARAKLSGTVTDGEPDRPSGRSTSVLHGDRPMVIDPHIAVIGAGITGVTTAYALLEHGYDVTVFDRQRYAAMETSFANGGQLSASNAEVWNHSSTVCQGHQVDVPKRDAPLLMNPRPSLAQVFLDGGVRRQASRKLPAEHHRDRAARHRGAQAPVRDGGAREASTSTLETRGILHFYRQRARPATTRDEVNGTARGRRAGPRSRDGGARSGHRADADSATTHGGFFTPSDATGDIHKFTRGLAACAGAASSLGLRRRRRARSTGRKDGLAS